MSCTRGRREAFQPCGHRGYGKFCHRCVQAQLLEDKKGSPAVIAHLRANKKTRTAVTS